MYASARVRYLSEEKLSGAGVMNSTLDDIELRALQDAREDEYKAYTTYDQVNSRPWSGASVNVRPSNCRPSSYSVVFPSKCSLSFSASALVACTTPSRWFGGA